MYNNKRKSSSNISESKCHICGSKLYDAGPNIGQCSNKKCKAEHTVINSLPDDSLTDCQYKDFYG